jgi:hypothetical protein
MLRRAFVAALAVVVGKSWFPTLGIEFLVGSTKGNITVGELSGGVTVSMMIVLAFAFIAAIVEAVLFSKPS